MAVLQMQRITICALKKDRKQLLEFLQRKGVVEITNEISEDDVFHKMDVSIAVSLLEKGKKNAEEAIRILNERVPEKTPMLAGLGGRSIVDKEVYDEFAEKRDKISQVVNRIVQIEKQLAESKSELARIGTQAEMLIPWSGLDIPLNFKGTKTTKAYIGTLSGEWVLDDLYQEMAFAEEITIDRISSNKMSTNLFVLCRNEDAEQVFEKLRNAGFSYPSIQGNKPPMEMEEDLKLQTKEVLQDIEALTNELGELSKEKEEIRFYQDYCTLRLEKYEVLGSLPQSKNIFVITGYLPEEDCADLEQSLYKDYEIHIEFSAPSDEEDVPVKLKNNKFVEPLEGTIESFSLPGKGEMDPTAVTAIFYYFLFGLMLSDAVYGLVMVICCGSVLLKFGKTMEDGLNKAMKMFFYCGISTTFWGVMFGSYLGDIVDTFSASFLGKMVSIPPVWFFPVKEPMRMLVFSMLLGIIHLLTGLTMKLYQNYKAKDYIGIVYDVIFWYFLLIGSILALMGVPTFTNTLGLTISLPGAVTSIGGILAAVGAIGIVLTNGRESKNPFKRFLKGLYALYGITGYLSDILSYSRLLALGLATGVICTVINKMASMTAIGPLGIIPFLIIVIFGHTLNIAINALGAYVHTTRLQYVEFFGKFYNGGGRSFRPFKVNTKYYKIKEN